jgi:hypothetical protein
MAIKVTFPGNESNNKTKVDISNAYVMVKRVIFNKEGDNMTIACDVYLNEASRNESGSTELFSIILNPSVNDFIAQEASGANIVLKLHSTAYNYLKSLSKFSGAVDV